MTNVYRQRLSGPGVLGTSISYTLALRPAPSIVGRLVYITDINEVQLDTGTQWVTVGALAGGGQLIVNALASVSAGGIIPTPSQNRQLTPVVGTPGEVTTSLTTALAAGINGYEHFILGTDDELTVTIDPTSANMTMNGPITLYNGTQIGFTYYSGKWVENSRSI